MKTCPECGKRFACWPEFWPYRRGEMYFCQTACMEAYDGREYRRQVGWMNDYYRRKKEEKAMQKKIALEQKKKAVEIAIGGGDPLKYLEECGSKNPSAHWHYIRKTLKEKDPVLFARIPEKPPEKKEAPKVELTIRREDLEEISKEANESVSKAAIDAAMENIREIMARQEQAPVTRPVNYDGFEVMAVKSPDTGFRFEFDNRYGLVTWRTVEGDEVTKTSEEWHKMAEELPKVLQIFGI